MAEGIGLVKRVCGPLIEILVSGNVNMLDMVQVGEDRLIGEIVRIKQDIAFAQVYEDTTGVTPDTVVYSQGEPLSVELGPGLLGTIYDGIQRPLEHLRDASGYYIKKGVFSQSLCREKIWEFVPVVKEGDTLKGGFVIGEVAETEAIKHKVMVPPACMGTVVKIVEKGKYTVDEIVCVLEDNGKRHEIKMCQRWPVRKGRPFHEKKPLSVPLVTGQRVIDTLFPIPKGGTVAIPGGFGTGKTMTQHAVAKWCDADIIVYIGCGERGNEMTDVLMDFPKLIDPHNGRPLMERTLLIANTSNMPVAAREASIYTGITLAEYYRDMGYHVALMADSTSRWAEALRELSGRMEEMPADEGFPAYLPTRLAEFYERAGYVENLGRNHGSISIIGAVSPPGGDFSEPVTQHSKRFVRAFWALDRHLANARHYPAISWIDSYSGYVDDISDWWQHNVSHKWKDMRFEVLDLLHREARLQQVVKLIGEDVLPDSQKLVLEVCRYFKNSFLQQNAFDDVDKYCVAQKQIKMMEVILTFYKEGKEAMEKGLTLVRLKRLRACRQISKMKYSVKNDEHEKLDKIIENIKKEITSIGEMYEAEF